MSLERIVVSRKSSRVSIADLKSPEGSKGSPVSVPLLDDEEEEEEEEEETEEAYRRASE